MMIIFQSAKRARLDGRTAIGVCAGLEGAGRAAGALTTDCSAAVTLVVFCSATSACIKNTLGFNKCFFSWGVEARV